MIYNMLLLIILNLICVGINITMFFLVIRAVMLWKKMSFFKAFDDAGKALVNAYTRMIDRLWSRMTQKHLTLKGNLLIGLVLLELTRVVIVGLAKLL